MNLVMEIRMSLKPLNALKALIGKSAKIQIYIEDEMKKKHPDRLRVIVLKKQRLKIKDTIQRMRRRARAAQH